MSILKKLLSYSWDAKAVLSTPTTFALVYGKFGLIVKFQSSDELAKSVGTLKGVSSLLEKLKKHQQAFKVLNKVIKATLEVIKFFIELEKLSIYDKNNDVKVVVYWAIVTIVAGMTQLYCLISNNV